MYIIKKILHILIILILIFAITYFLGRSVDIHTFEAIPFIVHTLFLFLIVSNKKVFWFLGFPLIILSALYIPTAVMYGFPNEDIILALFYTNPGEAFSYLIALPTKYYLYPIALLFLTLIFYFSYIKFHKKIRYSISISALITLICLYCIPIFHGFIINQSYPFGFYRQISESLLNIYHHYSDSKGMSLWEIKEVQPKYQNYVLVIGESARKDFQSVYGYSQQTTPFLDSTNGIFIDGFVSAGCATIPSLSRMLTFSPDHQFNYRQASRRNLVELAKLSGFQTHWISNQGKFGTSESPIALLGKKSDTYFFTKDKGSDLRGPSDWELVTKFKKELELNHSSQKPQLYIIHLMGSHYNACDRIETVDPKFQHPNGSNYLCYLTSIQQTDNILKELNQNLNKQYQTTQQAYSMIYVADHAQIGTKDNLMHGCKHQDGFNVPLLKISSDDVSHTVIKAQKSGLYFIEGMAYWLGIKESVLTKKNDLFSAKEDENMVVWDGNEYIPFDSLPLSNTQK